VVEQALGFEEAGVVDEFSGGQEDGGVGFFDCELGVEDEGEGCDFFDAGRWLGC